MELFSLPELGQRWGISGSWQLFQEKHKKVLGTASRRTRSFQVWLKNTLQVSEDIAGRVTKNLSQEFSRTESRILGALSKLDEFLLNLQIRTCSRTVPGTSRWSDLENREPTGDRFQNDPYPKVELSTRRASNLTDSDPEETSHN